jgi:hypothetical protein
MKNPPFARRLGGWLSLMLGLAALPSSRAENPPTVQRSREGKLPATLHAVQVDHRLGPVTITGTDRDFGWRWNLDCSGDAAAAEAFAQKSELEVAETEGTLQVRLRLAETGPVRLGHPGPSSGLLGWVRSSLQPGSVEVHSSLELRVPRAVALDLTNRFGAMTVSAVRGPLTVEGQNAAVDITDISGAVRAATSFARMLVERTGSAQLHNQNGSIVAHDIRGDLQAGSSFARVQVQSVRGRAQLTNQNGEITAENVSGDVTAATSFGALRVHDLEGRAELHNQNGAIDAVEIGGSVLAESSFADLRLDHIGGGANLKCQNGRIEVHQLGGTIVAWNSFAPLRVDAVRGDAVLDSQNGEIVAHGVTGALRAKTSFGRIQLEGDGQYFEANNENGPVQITAHSPMVARITASTSFGPIEVRLPADCQPGIHAHTTFGKVRSDFPVNPGLLLPEASAVHGSLPEVTLRGQNSDIRIQLLAQ